MGTLSQGSPAGTLTGLGYPASLTFDGAYFRDLVDEPLGVLERYEVILYRHETDHIGEDALWTYRGNIDSAGVELDTFSLQQFLGLRLSDGDYCWSVRLRDRLGTWTAVVHEATFSLLAAAPVLSDQRPDQVIAPSLEVMAGTRFSAAYSDDDSSPARAVVVELIEQVASEGWEDGVYTNDLILWAYNGPPRKVEADRIEVRYSGRTLPDNRTYLWRMKARNAYGRESGWVGGQFTLIDRVTPAVDPVSTTTDAFTQVWETDVVPKPVGIAYLPDDVGYIRVVDRQNRQLCTVVEADRTLGFVYDLPALVAYPAGLSSDPSDIASFLWVLSAPWTQGGGTSGNKVIKLNRGDLTVADSWDPGDGKWTAMKVSSNWVYLTNWDTNEIARFDHAGALNGTWGITYETVVQTHPTGIMVDGTTLYYFFYNDGDTKRFLMATEANPEDITGAKSTEGLAIVGGEMDTTTHTEMYGDSDLLGKVWKFTLKTVVYGDGIAATRLRPSQTTYGDA